MAKHLTIEQLDAYGQQRWSFAELIATDAHLAECAACRQRLEAALPGSTMALYADLQVEAASPAHLSFEQMAFEQMANYVDDTLDHAASLIVGDHLASCMQCAHATEDLRKFAATDQASPRPVVESQTSWWERAREWMRVPAFGWALAALLSVVALGWLLWRRPADAPQYANRDATPTPLLLLSPTPSVPEPAPLLAQLNDSGRQITLDRQGKLSGLESLSPAHQQMVKDALTNQRLPRPDDLNNLNRRGSSLMGADDQGHRFALQAPAGKAVLSDRPTFNWTPLTGATSYVVEIYDEQFNLVEQSDALTQSQFTPPRPLARGRVYAWQVKAVKDGQTVIAPAPPASQARFRVVSSTSAEAIAQAKRASAGSHLALALLYLQAGLLDEAEAELRALRQANPNSEAVRRWLAQVQALSR